MLARQQKGGTRTRATIGYTEVQYPFRAQAASLTPKSSEHYFCLFSKLFTGLIFLKTGVWAT